MGRGGVWQGDWCAWGKISDRVGRDQGGERQRTGTEMGERVGENAGKNKSKNRGRREAGLTGHKRPGEKGKKEKRGKEMGRGKGKVSRSCMISTASARALPISAVHIPAGTGGAGAPGQLLEQTHPHGAPAGPNTDTPGAGGVGTHWVMA